MTKRLLWTVPLVALLYGCSGSGSSDGPIGTSTEKWELVSDRQSGNWEVMMMTSDKSVQEAFVTERNLDFNEIGEPVLWLRKTNGMEPYEPKIWAVDGEGNRTPFNYARFSGTETTFIAVSLMPTTGSSSSFNKIQMETMGELVSEWDIRSPGFEAPSTWPTTVGEGHEMNLAGVDLSIKPRRHFQQTTAGISSFNHLDEVEVTAGIDEDFVYELRYLMLDEPNAKQISHFFNRPEQPQQGRGGGGQGRPAGGQQAATEQVDSYEASVLCRMMKYQVEPFTFTWDSSVALFTSLEELEEHSTPRKSIENNYVDVYGIYWNPEYYGPGYESLWVRIKGNGKSRIEFNHELQADWNSTHFENSSAGRLVDQYLLEDGSTVLVFEGSGLGEWKDGDFTLSGTLRNINDYEEKVFRMTLPVTKIAPVTETDSEE